VSHFYHKHTHCLEALAGGPFTLVATIPSNNPDAPAKAFHIMWRVVEKVGALAQLWQPLLLEADTTLAPVLADRRSHRDAFRVRATRLDKARVLLVDDLFVSGAHVQSAASALIETGAAAVVALVIARLINPASRDPYSAGIWQEACERPFNFNHCCVCDPAREFVA
jgi:predicted amidophosphoribosyltransferase